MANHKCDKKECHRIITSASFAVGGSLVTRCESMKNPFRSLKNLCIMQKMQHAAAHCKGYVAIQGFSKAKHSLLLPFYNVPLLNPPRVMQSN